MGINAIDVAGAHPEARAHHGRAQGDLQAFVGALLQQPDVSFHGGQIGAEFLPQGDGHRVFETCPGQLDDILVFHHLPGQHGFQYLQGIDDFQVQGEFQAGHDHIAGGLAAIDMIIGMDGVIALAPDEDLVGPVGQHLVDIHVRGGAAAALDDANREIAGVYPTRHHLIGGGANGLGNRLWNRADIGIGEGRRLLDPGQRRNIGPPVADGLPGDGEISPGAFGMDAVIDVGGDGQRPQGVGFLTLLGPNQVISVVPVIVDGVAGVFGGVDDLPIALSMLIQEADGLPMPMPGRAARDQRAVLRKIGR